MAADRLFVLFVMIAIGVLLFWAEIKTRRQRKRDDDDKS